MNAQELRNVLRNLFGDAWDCTIPDPEGRNFGLDAVRMVQDFPERGEFEVTVRDERVPAGSGRDDIRNGVPLRKLVVSVREASAESMKSTRMGLDPS